MTPADGLAVRGQRLALQALLAAPRPLRRAIAGRPLRLDGDALEVENQVLLRLTRSAAAPRLGPADIPRLRDDLRRGMRVAGGTWPIGRVEDLDVAGVPVRRYSPTRPDPAAAGAVVVFLHGGGFIAGDIATYDPVCRFLAERSGVELLSAEYRLAPEHPFPAAYDDCVAVFEWVHAHAAELGVDPHRIAVAGDSAGGNLAAGVALAAGERCAFQLLMYPGTTAEDSFPSRELFGTGFLLTNDFIDLAVRSYAGGLSGDALTDPAAAPLHATVPRSVAPAHVVTAAFDPLRDEGEAYAAKLREAGVEVHLERTSGQLHGYIGLLGVSRSARRATEHLADVLRTWVRG
ncbi:alpha/beta hydrolase [Nocardioides mangrovicus]|uniref:Alpha/beta hydrolase n=1 Tax=Nocardioides mangrovicus TaxID=2478913 RepID=A0A3L8P928_9ACTN|nr:alpha/beta hydrolase [Nocardioides mangrovicus]RLV51138.1 alpha/beta hydrolase [Nocardioides mangrovicus]